MINLGFFHVFSPLFLSFFLSFFTRLQHSWITCATLFSRNLAMSLSTKEKTHLINVYAGLGGCFTLSAAGIYAGFMGAWTGIATLSSFILMIWLALTPPPAKPELRLKLLFALSFSLGLASYPLLEGVGQGLVFSALSTTAICFFTFTLWALFSDRQVFVFLGAWLSLGLSSLYWLRFFQAFLPLKGTHALELYLGLLVFSGYGIISSF